MTDDNRSSARRGGRSGRYQHGAPHDARSSRHNTARRGERRGQQHRGSEQASKRSSYSADYTRQPSRSASRSRQASKTTSSARDYSRSSYSSSASSVSDYSSKNYTARKSGNGKKIIIAVVAVLVVALVGCGIAAAVWLNNVSTNIKGNDDITNLVAPAANEPYYVLLMGSDKREGWEPVGADDGGERSDSIMVARVDEKQQQVSIISVPRDLRVKINGHGYQKINSTIEYGGYNLLIQTLNEILGIKINYYATVYFQGFLDLVDTLGGVTVQVPEGTATYSLDESYPEVILPAGDAVELNGSQALVLARCRHGWPIDQGAYAMGDYQRTLNQRNLIKAIAKKVLEQDITKLPALIESLSKCVETNMSIEKIVALAQNMKGMDIEEMQSAQIPIGASTIGGEWEAVIYQDVFELMDSNFKLGNPLFEGLAGFDPEMNDDDVFGNYIDGPVYAYTTYSFRFGSPYSDGYVPSTFTEEAIERTKAGVKSSEL